MTSRAGSPLGPTASEAPAGSSTTSEHVASKLKPLSAPIGRPEEATASRTAAQAARQMSGEECSTTPPASCQIAMGCLALATSRPASSKIPARALPVPTSTPIYASVMNFDPAFLAQPSHPPPRRARNVAAIALRHQRRMCILRGFVLSSPRESGAAMAKESDSESNRIEDAARAGWLYYIAGNTQDEIASKLGVSRQTAQRLVSLAVSRRLIKVRLDHPIAECLRLADLPK